MMNLSIQSFQQIVGLLLLLQIDIGRDVCKIHYEALLLIEGHWHPVYDYGLGTASGLVQGVVVQDYVAHWQFMICNHIVDLYSPLTIRY